VSAGHFESFFYNCIIRFPAAERLMLHFEARAENLASVDTKSTFSTALI